MITPGPAFACTRSLLVAGAAVAVVGAAAVLPAPPAPPRPAPVADIATWTAAAALPLDVALPALDTVPAASAVSDGIATAYLALEEWTRYGAQSLAWLLGWVPWVGRLAPQVNFFYDLSESITRGVVFNTAQLLGGDIDFGTALGNVSTDTSAAFDAFFAAQMSWLQHFLPPVPPLAALGTDALADLAPAPDLPDLLDLLG